MGCIYIYIYIERERYVYTYMYVYIYIYMSGRDLVLPAAGDERPVPESLLAAYCDSSV